MSARRAPHLLALVAVVLAGALPSAAQASRAQESTFQDDNQLIFSPPDDVAKTLDTLKGLGVDRLRISVFWATVAPAGDRQAKPDGFEAADPGAYPADAWNRYDTVVRLATARGLAVNFNLTSPAPFWATGSLDGRPDLDKNYEPSADEFAAFTEAVGRRYSGGYTAGGRPLPRVSYWTVWNEPNQPGWLTPQWTRDPRDASRFVEASPRRYRDLVDAAFAGLRASGHAKDTILIGETAPKGQKSAQGPTRAIKPGRFIRQLYCLDDTLQFLRGAAAEARGCPATDQARTFRTDHPALFAATGYAHHPYELTFSPTHRPGADDFTTGNLGELSSLLRRVYQRYGARIPNRKRDVPLYLTEYGYQTDPPDPTGISPARQAAYLNEAEYLTYRNPRVQTLTQFLLVDDVAAAGVSDPIAAFGATFQSGLQTADGAPKRALLAYRLPFHLPARRIVRGRSLRAWGLVRAAANNRRTRARLQYRSGRGPFRTLRTVTPSRARGYVDVRVKPKRSGTLRLQWTAPNGTRQSSRSISFRVVSAAR